MMQEGGEMVMIFDIILYALRIYQIKKLGIQLDEKMIEEYLYTVHDWIEENFEEKQKTLKSRAYKIKKRWKV